MYRIVFEYFDATQYESEAVEHNTSYLTVNPDEEVLIRVHPDAPGNFTSNQACEGIGGWTWVQRIDDRLEGWVPSRGLRTATEAMEATGPADDLGLDEEAIAKLLPGLIGDVMSPKHHVYGKIALFSESNGKCHAPFVKPFGCEMFLNLCSERSWSDQQTNSNTDAARLARLSCDGELQYRAHIEPGGGFSKGLWLPPELDEFCHKKLFVFVAGFNDKRYQREHVKDKLREHFLWYGSLCEMQQCRMCFVEVDDQQKQGNSVEWLTEAMKELCTEEPYCQYAEFIPSAREGDADVSGRFVFPCDGWSSGHYERDSYHLTDEGLDQWIPKLSEFVSPLCGRYGLDGVVFIGDSTFAAHNYNAVCEKPSHECNLSIRTAEGETHVVSFPPSATMRALKKEIVERRYPHHHVEVNDLHLASRGGRLVDNVTIGQASLCDGAELLLTSSATGTLPEAGGPDSRLPPEAYYVPSDLLRSKTKWVYRPGTQTLYIPFQSSVGAWSRTWLHGYSSTAFNQGYKLAEQGHYVFKGEGVFAVNDPDVAFNYARNVQLNQRCYQLVIAWLLSPDDVEERDGIFRVPGLKRRGGKQNHPLLWPNALVIREVDLSGSSAEQRAVWRPPLSPEEFEAMAWRDISQVLVHHCRHERKYAYVHFDELFEKARHSQHWHGLQLQGERAAAMVLRFLREARHSDGRRRFAERQDCEFRATPSSRNVGGSSSVLNGRYDGMQEKISRALTGFLRHDNSNQWTSLEEAYQKVVHICPDKHFVLEVMELSNKAGKKRYEVDRERQLVRRI